MTSPSRLGLALLAAAAGSSGGCSSSKSAARPDPGVGDFAVGADDDGGGGVPGGADMAGYHAAGPPEFGPHVLLFDPSMATATMQKQLDDTFHKQEQNQFGTDRYAYFFKPGAYTLDAQLGFFVTAHGLGASPDDVTITGAVRAKADWFNGNATQNFWRGAENLSIVPTQDHNVAVWAVSQATELRRIHVKGSINLWDSVYKNAWSSGGFMSDSKVDVTIDSGTQQQFLLRNDALHHWQGGNWNMVFVGSDDPPAGAWPGAPYTIVATTPTVREKPFLTIDAAGSYAVMVPALRSNAKGISWGAGLTPGTSLPISRFYIAHADQDNADTLNAALDAGANLVLTPGVYRVASALRVERAGTVVLGLGVATLYADHGNVAMTVADVDGVSIAGVLFDAGAQDSPTLLQLGDAKSATRHAAHPTALYDVSCRIGGATAARASSCLVVHSNDVLLDNVWLWRADHSSGVGWDTNPAKNGVIVNGDNVTAYGLFVEHFEEYQTLWNGDNGRVYFYQSEIPYDVPSQARWTHDGKNGFASLALAAGVTRFDARGLGAYCVFYNPVVLENAFEGPASAGVQFQHMITVWLGKAPGSAIQHILNGQGGTVQQGTTTARSTN